MANPFTRLRWSPYAAGAGIGILSWLTFGLMDEALGVSTTFVRLAALLESTVAADHVRQTPYLASHMQIDWQMMLVLGVLLGAMISAALGGELKARRVPELWAWRFGPGRALRYTMSFLGGVILLFGARLAGGCTSGHAISGSLQFALSSWLFFISFFVVSVLTAFVLFGGKGRHHVNG